jgi:hypothetical protein
MRSRTVGGTSSSGAGAANSSSRFGTKPRAPRRIHPPLAGKVLDRVAGDEVDQRERQQRHADERGDDQRDAAQQEAQHLRQ